VARRPPALGKKTLGFENARRDRCGLRFLPWSRIDLSIWILRSGRRTESEMQQQTQAE
jgi:hypothetical protein